VLLVVSCLLRRADAVEVIGAALAAKAAGVGYRRIAARLGRPTTTVRGGLRAFARNAEGVRVVFTALLSELDPLTGPLPPAGSGLSDAVEAIGAGCWRGPPMARCHRRGVGVAAGLGGDRRAAACPGRAGRVDQHGLALGRG
jgi:hypothetical protein